MHTFHISLHTCTLLFNSGVSGGNVQTFILQPNKGVEVSLSSITTSEVGGKWKFASETSVFSEFFLGAKIPENQYDVDNCCSPALASYLSASWRDAPGLPEYNNNTYLTEVANFFNEEPVWSSSNLDLTRECGKGGG